MSETDVLALCIALVSGVALMTEIGPAAIWGVVVTLCAIYVLLGNGRLQ